MRWQCVFGYRNVCLRVYWGKNLELCVNCTSSVGASLRGRPCFDIIKCLIDNLELCVNCTSSVTVVTASPRGEAAVLIINYELHISHSTFLIIFRHVGVGRPCVVARFDIIKCLIDSLELCVNCTSQVNKFQPKTALPKGGAVFGFSFFSFFSFFYF